MLSEYGIYYRYALQNQNSFDNEVAEKFRYCLVITGPITSLFPYGRISYIIVQGRSKRKQHFGEIQVHYLSDLNLHKKECRRIQCLQR